MNTTKKILMVLATVAILCSCQSGDDDDSNVNTEYDDCMAIFMSMSIGLFECEGIPWNDETESTVYDGFRELCSESCGDAPSYAHDYAVACGESAIWVFNEELGECDVDTDSPEYAASEKVCDDLSKALPCLADME